MYDSDQIAIDEFRIEAHELLDEAEKSLLAIDQGQPFEAHYSSVFRVFHTLKGAAGMLGLVDLQVQMQKLESSFHLLKTKSKIEKSDTDFFLKATEVSRDLLSGPNIVPNNKQKSKGPSHIVYIVDDEPDIVEIISGILSEFEFEIHGFSRVEDVLGAIIAKKPTVVVSDIQMPFISGPDLLREVKKIDPELPVIFVSGQIDKRILLEAITNGVFAVIEKPFNATNLISTVLRASERFQILKLLERSIHMVMYQFSDLDEYLVSKNKNEERDILKAEIESLQAQFKLFRSKK